jgi:hypothetical protein
MLHIVLIVTVQSFIVMVGINIQKGTDVAVVNELLFQVPEHQYII